MSNPDEVSGVFGVIDTEEHVAPQPTAAETKTETPPADTPKDEKPEAKQPAKQTTDAEADNEDRADVQNFNRTETEDEAPEETKTEPLQTETETKTETKTDEIDWVSQLPPPPPKYAGKQPEIDENGQLVNMTPLEYAQYIEDRTINASEHRGYAKPVETKALEAAEQILPEIKTSPAVRNLVENARVASIINGEQIDSYEAAKQVREALGLAPERLAKATAEARAQGVQSAKTSIEIQKRSGVETGGATQKPKAPSKADKLGKRLQSGDDSAFEELFEILAEEGKI